MDEIIKHFGSRVKTDISFKELTTLQIGGPAKYFLKVQTEKELLEIVKIAAKGNIPYLIVASGSNLLVSDQGFDGLVIQNSISAIEKDDNSITVKSGTPLQDLVNFTLEQGFPGLQKLTGIPGTVGGAVYGNAGAYGQTISDYLTEVSCFDGSQKITKTRENCHFTYRESAFKQSKLIILDIKFTLPKGSRELLQSEAEKTLELRLKKYKPGIKCPGSFFKNVLTENLSAETKNLLPPYKDTFGKIPAWLFLEGVGGKGASLGKIKIADFHANLFINQGDGTAADFWQLAWEYSEKVKEKYQVQLEPEVQLINLPPLS
ncbi:MAG: UDP-N-acetylmuramate dehydrogenase [Candidatus Daviesbacteria bacterium]|nr:UDP-N-acetylmuramate dehydrogenase [Candidatus Daviesbacteria bacterium]